MEKWWLAPFLAVGGEPDLHEGAVVGTAHEGVFGAEVPARVVAVHDDQDLVNPGGEEIGLAADAVFEDVEAFQNLEAETADRGMG